MQEVYSIYKEDKNTDKWTDNFVFNSKTFGLFNIRNLEQKTGYNFFGNLPIEIQNAIEVRNVPDIKQRINSFGTNSTFLMAEELPLSEIPSVTPLRLFERSSTWHDSIPDQIHATANSTFSGFSTLEISSDQNAVFDPNIFTTTHLGKSSIDLTQVTPCEVGLTKSTAADISRKQIGMTDNSIVHITFFEGGSTQIGSSKIGSGQIDSFKIGSSQVSSAQVGSSHIQSRVFKSDIGSSEHDISQNHTLEEFVQLGFAESTKTPFNQFNTIENSFSSIVPFDQLISSHFSHSSSSFVVKFNPRRTYKLFSSLGFPNAKT